MKQFQPLAFWRIKHLLQMRQPRINNTDPTNKTSPKYPLKLDDFSISKQLKLQQHRLSTESETRSSPKIPTRVSTEQAKRLLKRFEALTNPLTPLRRPSRHRRAAVLISSRKPREKNVGLHKRHKKRKKRKGETEKRKRHFHA